MSVPSQWRARLGGVGVALLAGAMALGCSPRMLLGVPRVPTIADCPGALVSTDEIAGAFMLRQDVRVDSNTVEIGVRLVVEKRGRRLVVVGFNTLGFEAFSIIQEGTDTTVDAPLGPAWGLPPLNVLRDLHRSRFLAVPGGPFTDGEVRATREGLTVTEQWRAGRLMARSLAIPGTDPADAVRVTFAGDATTITHGSCGYEATIVTTSDDATSSSD